MRCRFLVFLLMALLPAAAATAGEEGSFRVAEDIYLAGSEPAHRDGAAEDLFIAGDTLRVTAPVRGTAHMMGRRIEATAAIGGDAYAAGMEVTLEGDVEGDASLMGYEVVAGSIAGDLRATGARVRLSGPVGGYALVAAETLTLEAAIGGDLHLDAREVTFGPVARVDGRLVLYEAEPGTLEVPERVAPPERVERRERAEWQGDAGVYAAPSWGEVLIRFAIGLGVVALLAGLTAAVLPAPMAQMRRRLLETPGRALWFGFLAQSALVGSAFVLALTGIGILLMPAIFLVAGLLGLAGYIVGVYAFGVGILHMLGRAFPTGWRDRAIAAATGALSAGLLGLVPVLGWIFVLALGLAGIGTIVLGRLRPRFFV